MMDLRIERRVDLRGHGNAKISRHSDSSVCEYRLLSLASFTQPTIHSAPSFAFARSILSKPLAPYSRLQTSSRHLEHSPAFHQPHLRACPQLKIMAPPSTFASAAAGGNTPTTPRTDAAGEWYVDRGLSELCWTRSSGGAKTSVCKRLTRRDL
jgi:hypothetical protein